MFAVVIFLLTARNVLADTAGRILPVNATTACGPNQPLLVTQKLGFILSPKFDNFHFYPPNARCSWILQAPEDQVIVLTTMAFGVNTDCNTDILEIFEGIPPSGRKVGNYCGYFIPSMYRSKTNTLFLKFRTGPVPRNTGFQFYFQHDYPLAECTGDQIRCRHQTACVDRGRVCDGIDDCKDGTDEQNCDAMLLEAPCGEPKIPPILGNDKIVGGRDAVPGSWPWQVSLRQIDMVPFSHMCGGVLISRQWVLSAAHCFRKKMHRVLWNVLLGKHFKLVPDDDEQLRYIEEIHIHPDYKGHEAKLSSPWLIRKQHDIALLKLNAPVTINDVVRPVCLPSNRTRLLPGEKCYVTGWGDTYRSGFELVLKQAVLPVISRETCRKMHFLYPIAETMVCAGYQQGGHDSCQGDSGGPLVYRPKDGKWTLAGIVSTGGSICADKDQPGIYTYVPYYVNWISNVTKLSFPGSL